MPRARAVTVAVGLLVAAPPLASHASAQQGGTPVAVAPARPDYRVLWDAVKACSGATDTAGKYAAIHWTGGLRTTAQGEPLLAGYFPPDTIYLSARAESEAWVIAHELLHALLGPTSVSHPAMPFLFPCKLMDFQQPGRVFMSPRERG